jgi:hypothetical protein
MKMEKTKDGAGSRACTNGFSLLVKNPFEDERLRAKVTDIHVP